MTQRPGTSLSVNVNKVATLRNTRPLGYPSPALIARLALEAGADGITVHPRPDERHIRPADVSEIEAVVRVFPGREFNIEGNPLMPGFIDLVARHKPDQVTLVPDSLEAATSDHGWPLADAAVRASLLPLIREFHSQPARPRVSLFVDAFADAADHDAVEAMRAARDVGADRVELYTEPYAAAFAAGQTGAAAAFSHTAAAAKAVGLGVNAGHDLTLENLGLFLAACGRDVILEVSIGHALIADALVFGITETVHRYVAMCRPPVVATPRHSHDVPQAR